MLLIKTVTSVLKFSINIITSMAGATIHDENGAKTIIRSQHLYSET
jgi:hypothetical protein